eukprot:1555737-Pyramimonas_sp.AAC.1
MHVYFPSFSPDPAYSPHPSQLYLWRLILGEPLMASYKFFRISQGLLEASWASAGGLWGFPRATLPPTAVSLDDPVRIWNAPE